MRNPEMLEALSALAVEKGISEEIMLEALANALVTAYKRMPDAAEEALVEIDVETGEIRVIAQELDEDGNVVREWDDTPADFGRIAAQTAKQVILQRIREAEREMKYEEYAGREGDIVTGIIQQTDARYTLLDLGRVEALLPQAEQVAGRPVRPRLAHEGVHRRGAQDGQGPADRRVAHASRAREAALRARGAGARRRCRRDPGRRARARSPHEARGRVERPERRPGRRVCRRARHARPSGRERAARREGRHRSLQRRRARLRDARARAGEGARGAHPRGHRHRRGHRPRLPAVARDRQGRPERAARGAAHRLAGRHQERDAARGGRGGRRLRRRRVGRRTPTAS